MWNVDDIKRTVREHKIVVFAKGTKDQPMCGFSHRAIEVMKRVGRPFEVINIFDDASIRPALVEAFNWPTTPQVFVDGELLGGSDIVLEMLETGELQRKVDAAFASA
ncbi:MAG: glutaredoxin [Planctomycetes bacterium]|nr:glutaredoxin [Planctomycetota bacterium]